MNAPHTAESVARWMLSEIEKHGELYQASAVADISGTFGDDFTTENDRGNMAIAKPVLAAFRKLTSDTVVWDRNERMWRKREPSDDPSRQQQ